MLTVNILLCVARGDVVPTFDFWAKMPILGTSCIIQFQLQMAFITKTERDSLKKTFCKR